MKKPKISFGEGGLKGFMAQHVEKIVLGFVMLLVAYFLYAGYSLEGYNSARNPKHLQTQTQETNSHILRDTALTRVSGDPARVIIEDHKNRAEKSRFATSGADYPVRTSNQPHFPNKLKRGDVKILAAEHIEARGLLVSLHTNSASDHDPFENDTSPQLKKKESSKKKDDSSAAGAAPGGAPGGLGEGGGGLSGGSGGDAKKGKSGGGKSGMPGGGGKSGMPGGGGKSGMPGGGKSGMPGGGMSGMPGAGEGGKSGMPGAGGMSGMPGGGGGGGGPGGGGSMSADYRRHYIDYSPGGASMMVATGSPALGQTQYVVSIVGLFPYEKQVEEYQRVFADSMDYESSRDGGPNFSGVIVERAEIPENANGELQWIAIKAKRYNELAKKWPGFMPEIADPRYVDPKITKAMPPAMLVDPVKFGLHPEIPQVNSVVESEESEKPADDSGSQDDEDSPFAGPSQNNFGSGRSGMAGGGMSGMPGAGGGMSGMPGGGGGRSGMSGMPGGGGMSGMPGGGGMSGMGGGGGRSGMPGGGGMSGMSGMPGGGGRSGMSGMPGGGGMSGMSGMPGGGGMSGMSGMPGGGGMSGMSGMPGGGGMSGGMSGGYSTSVKPPKYKMIRFFDFEAERGKKYKYRVRVVVDDPNNPPRGSFVAPDERYLESAVATRIRENRKKTRIESEFSPESNPVSLPNPTQFVAGAIDRSAFLGVSEPAAKLLAVTWNDERALPVPALPLLSDRDTDADKAAVFRGSLLNFIAKEAKILRPDSLELKGIKDFEVKTNALVLDLRPGSVLPVGKKANRDRDRTPLRSGGEVLLMDDSGNLVVRDEFEDADQFRRFTYDGEETGGAMAGGMGGGAGAGGGSPGLGGLGGLGDGPSAGPGNKKK